MADNTVSNLLNNTLLYRYNPSLMQSGALDIYRNISDGKINIVDPTSPLVMLLECSAVNVAGFMVENLANTRKMYPSLAQTEEDLYKHMSDRDYIDRFSAPALGRFSFRILKNQLLTSMIEDSQFGGKKIIIPRNTEISIGDGQYTFSLQYPIVIRELIHGGIQITYDTTEESPIQSLTSNVIDYEFQSMVDMTEWLYFEVDAYQFKIKTTTNPITSGASYKQSISFEDYFYHARVYYKNSNTNGMWTEMYTTHSDQVYDKDKPTAVLRVISNDGVGSILDVFIPQVYIRTGLVSSGSIRVDIYQTKGSININPEDYNLGSFSVNYRIIDEQKDSSIYTAALSNVTSLVYSNSKINGGKQEIGFEKLRQRVINNTIGVRNLPITNVQLEDAVDDRGFEIVKNVDVVVNRQILATRTLPDPFDEKLITPGSATIETLITSLSNLTTYDNVKNNGTRVTITPDIIYRNTNGINTIVSKNEIDLVKSKGSEEIANFVSNNNLFFTPFHYVLDTSFNQFEVRPYYLNNPKCTSIKFINQNQLTKLQVNTRSYSITKIDQGYSLKIVTKSNQEYKDIDDAKVFVQLAYKPELEDKYAFINGTQIAKGQDKERVFEFILESDFDLDYLNKIYFNNLKLYTGFNEPVYTDLKDAFRIVYSTTNTVPSTWIKSEVDDAFSAEFINTNDTIYGITLEEITIEFGKHLKHLWARSRSVASTGDFQRYTEVVYETYDKDTYEIDPVTNTIFTIVNGELVYTQLHQKGDFVLDSNGNKIIKHHIGDIVLDEDGNPTNIDPNLIVRQIDLMFIEGAYFFATDSSSAKYRTDIIDTIVSWITVDLDVISEQLLDRTSIFFYPKKSAGPITVVSSGGNTISIDSSQSFKVELYVNDTVFNNQDLRVKLSNRTIKTIDSYLKKSTISISEITSALRTVYGSDVTSVRLTGLGGDINLETISMLTDRDRCSIKKKLTMLADETLIVQEDIKIDFIKINK